MASIKTKTYFFLRFLYSNYTSVRFQRIIESFAEKRLSHRFYTNNMVSTKENEVICMIDGRVKHGGLTDRLNGIISTYHAAKSFGRPFKILFNHPFLLSDYLVPNTINWIIEDNDIDYSSNTKVIFLRANKLNQAQKREVQLIETIAANQHSQIHVYSNINGINNLIYHNLFNELFKPSERLKQYIDSELTTINTEYISATFRFQQLLNDFKEGDYEILDKEKADELITQCLDTLVQLHYNHPNKTILVTSDSHSFLQKAKQIPYVAVPSGKVIHMEYNDTRDFIAQGKAFVDLYLLSKSEIIYSIAIGPMMDSGFPRLAAKINNRPFVLIDSKPT